MAHARARLLYDRDCGFCRWSVAAVLKRDRGGRLRPVGIQTDEGAKLLSEMPAARRLASWHLVTEQGELVSGADALRPLLDRLDRPLLVRLVEAFPGPMRLGYELLAGSRGALGRLVSTAAGQRADAIITVRAEAAVAVAVATPKPVQTTEP